MQADLPTIAVARRSVRAARRSILALLLAGITSGLSAGSASAQSGSYQPPRLPQNSQPRQLGTNSTTVQFRGTGAQGATAVAGGQTTQSADARTRTAQPASSENVGNGVSLRWRTSERANLAKQQSNFAQPSAGSNTEPSTVGNASFVSQASYNTNTAGGVQQAVNHVPVTANPLRSQSIARPPEKGEQPRSNPVRPAAFQQPQASGGAPAPAVDMNQFNALFEGQRIAQAPQPPAGNIQVPPKSNLQLPPLGNIQLPPAAEAAPAPDALAAPEAAPVPGGLNAAPQLQLPGEPPVLPGTNSPQRMPIDPAPSLNPLDAPTPPGQLEVPDNTPAPRGGQSPSDRNGDQPGLSLPNRRDRSSSVDCDSIREKLRNNPLSALDLDPTPRFGDGLRISKEEADKERLNFAASAEVREWCSREGNGIIKGRMVDMKHESVILDVDGKRAQIPLRDLCDVDLAYIGKVWNLPSSCGAAYEDYTGRDFIPSAVEWKASGLCHKPLYFEEVQLERYGHEVGPVLQPVITTAHFFGNVAVLPYKMGIHPPQECQYALGYYRPGSCAPYMLPPVPISLRGAAAQAKVVIAGAALIP
ncbi:MAG: hypothetical protein U0892_04810 [Pirellulales bacterium]